MSIVEPGRERQRRCACAAAVVLALAGAAGTLCASDTITSAGTDVLLVYDAGSDASARVAEAYASARHVAPSHVVALDLGDASGREEISRGEFEGAVLEPLAAWWRACARSELPRFVALSRALPLRVSGSADRDGDEASLDSELVLLPRAAERHLPPLDGPLPNPRFADDWSEPFTAGAHGMCLVTRLDGFTTEDALALIARAVAADTTEAVGTRFVVDLRGGGRNTGEQLLLDAATALARLGGDVVLDTTATFLTGVTGVLGYASWGSNDVAYERPLGFTWVPGGIAATFVSSSARTLEEPPPTWVPGREEERERYYHGTPQSLAADLLRDGAAGASGYVSEPWLDGCVRPDRLMACYSIGMTLAESYYSAMPYVSWRGVVFGDPIARAPVGARLEPPARH